MKAKISARTIKFHVVGTQKIFNALGRIKMKKRKTRREEAQPTKKAGTLRKEETQ